MISYSYAIEGNPNGFAHINQLGQNVPVGEKERSSKIIADQLSLNEKTVRRASEFTLAVDRIVEVTEVKVNDILRVKKERLKGLAPYQDVKYKNRC